jgi:hypothetical protein
MWVLHLADHVLGFFGALLDINGGINPLRGNKEGFLLGFFGALFDIKWWNQFPTGQQGGIPPCKLASKCFR